MHKAAEGGHIEVIKYLTPMFGARVHEKDSSACTILHLAAYNGHCKVARYLVEILNIDLQDRDKVCIGCPGRGGHSKVWDLRVFVVALGVVISHVMFSDSLSVLDTRYGRSISRVYKS